MPYPRSMISRPNSKFQSPYSQSPGVSTLILILTTNRIGQCDTALASRVNITIEYPELDELARKTIWSMFVRNLREVHQRSVAVDIGEKDLWQLAKIDVNGRQVSTRSISIMVSRAIFTDVPIRSKTYSTVARIAAKDMGEALSISHIDLVLSITKPGLKAGWRPKPLANGVHLNGIGTKTSERQ